MNMKFLCFDISNLLYRTFFVQRDEDDETLAGMATHSALLTLNKYFKLYKPDKVVMAYDRRSWRKDYTASDKCVSKKPYKGNRRQDMTPAQQLKYQRFIEHLREFEALIAEHTTIISLVEDDLEADDLIAGFCQKFRDPSNEVIVISTDTDLLQLLRYESVRIISPVDGKDQMLAEFDGNPELYVFTKCLRGDPTDNVQSAYPRVHMTKIRKAFEDPYERTQMMQKTWTNQDKVEFKVQTLFEENQILIDLEKQPEDIRELITAAVAAAVAKQRKFSLFHIMRFIGKYKLVKIKESIDNFIPLLSC